MYSIRGDVRLSAARPDLGSGNVHIDLRPVSMGTLPVVYTMPPKGRKFAAQPSVTLHRWLKYNPTASQSLQDDVYGNEDTTIVGMWVLRGEKMYVLLIGTQEGQVFNIP